jgi:predicted phage terminase large subunit-like protein
MLPHYFEAIVQSWDPAVVDTETAAFSVCTTWGIQGRKLYLIDVLRKRLDFHKIEPAILHMKEKFNAGCVVLETAGVGLAIGNAVVKREGARRWLYDPTLGKVERAIAQTPKIERKRIYLPVNAPWLETFEAEVASFPMSKYYDQVDSMVQFLFLLDHRNQWTMDLSAVREHRSSRFDRRRAPSRSRPGRRHTAPAIGKRPPSGGKGGHATRPPDRTRWTRSRKAIARDGDRSATPMAASK